MRLVLDHHQKESPQPFEQEKKVLAQGSVIHLSASQLSVAVRGRGPLNVPEVGTECHYADLQGSSAPAPTSLSVAYL